MAITIVCDEKVADVSLKGKAMVHAVDHCAGLPHSVRGACSIL